MLSPLPRRSHEVHLPVSSSVPSAFPNRGVGRLSRLNPRTRLFAEAFFEAADIPLCLGLRVCSSPRSFLPLRILPQGSRDFYIRAPCASLPPHTPDMLAVRIKAIDGARTFTLQDSQPCRLLPPVYASPCTSRCPAQNSGSSGSLPLSRKALSSSAACRFIPAHEFPIWITGCASYPSPALDTTNLPCEQEIPGTPPGVGLCSRRIGLEVLPTQAI